MAASTQPADGATPLPRNGAAATPDDLFLRLDQLNEIGAALSLERDLNALLEKILIAAKTITRADGGTLYLVEGEDTARQLRFEIVRTASLDVALGGTTGNPIPFYPRSTRSSCTGTASPTTR